MSDLSTQKLQLREQMRSRRRTLSDADQTGAAGHLAKYASTLPAWSTAGSIALYLPNDGEIDTAQLTEAARRAGKVILLPQLVHKHLQFAVWEQSEALESNRYGIPEPPPGAAQREADSIDIICLPLVAWDRRGGRLGMGGGFYDRTLEGVSRPVLLGLAHGWQEVAEVPCGEFDVGLDFVATDNGLVHCQG